MSERLTCRDCRWCDLIEPGSYGYPEEMPQRGQCRRRAPMLVVVTGTRGGRCADWPEVVVDSDWCGDYERRSHSH